MNLNKISQNIIILQQTLRLQMYVKLSSSYLYLIAIKYMKPRMPQKELLNITSEIKERQQNMYHQPSDCLEIWDLIYGGVNPQICNKQQGRTNYDSTLDPDINSQSNHHQIKNQSENQSEICQLFNGFDNFGQTNEQNNLQKDEGSFNVYENTSRFADKTLKKKVKNFLVMFKKMVIKQTKIKELAKGNSFLQAFTRKLKTSTYEINEMISDPVMRQQLAGMLSSPRLKRLLLMSSVNKNNMVSYLNQFNLIRKAFVKGKLSNL